MKLITFTQWEQQLPSPVMLDILPVHHQQHVRHQEAGVDPIQHTWVILELINKNIYSVYDLIELDSLVNITSNKFLICVKYVFNNSYKD